MTLPLANVPFIMILVGVIWFAAAILLILLILMQKAKGGGLGAAFGGAGSNNLLGTKTGDFLTWVTIGLTVVFLLFGVLMAKYYKPAGLRGLQEDPGTAAVDTTGLFEEMEEQEQQDVQEPEEGELPPMPEPQEQEE